MSGSLPTSGASIVIKAWDASGIAIPESDNALPLKLSNRSIVSISGQAIRERFSASTTVTFEFTIESPKVLVTKVKAGADGTFSEEKSTICVSGVECAI
jgi:hypothetical protein